MRETADRPTVFCAGCQRYQAPGYLDVNDLCQRCARIDDPCEFMPEPRGAFGIAEGWCRTHNIGWAWCEHTKKGEGVKE